MKIIILGAGRVGQSVADSLVSERNDITVIDTDAARLRDLESRFDLRGVVGNGIEPAVLAEAGAQDTDLLIACAAQDETNLVCCKIAQLLFNIPKRVARVRSTGFAADERLPAAEGLAFRLALIRALRSHGQALAEVRRKAGSPSWRCHYGVPLSNVHMASTDKRLRWPTTALHGLPTTGWHTRRGRAAALCCLRGTVPGEAGREPGAVPLRKGGAAC